MQYQHQHFHFKEWPLDKLAAGTVDFLTGIPISSAIISGAKSPNLLNVNLSAGDVVTIQVEFNPVNGGESADIQAGENQHYFEMYQGVQTSQGGNGGLLI